MKMVVLWAKMLDITCWSIIGCYSNFWAKC